MPLSTLGAFGGILRICDRDYPVKGRSYRKIAEQQAWWVSQCFCPITELRRFLYTYPEFSRKDFVEKWIRTSRKEMVLEKDLQSKACATFEFRRFDIWQACRDGGLTLQALDDHLDSLTAKQAVAFFEEADRKMAIANGVDEFDYLASCFSISPSGGGGSKKTVESMIAQICVHAKEKMPLDSVLDATPAMMRTLFEDPEKLIDDSVAEKSLHPRDKIGQKRFSKIYEQMAENIVDGHRIDHYRPKVKGDQPEAPDDTQEPQRDAPDPTKRPRTAADNKSIKRPMRKQTAAASAD